MFRPTKRMGFAPDHLRAKALLALEEATQECRYRAPRRSFALRFALAYLWTQAPANREPFDRFWRALAQNDLWRFRAADEALWNIHCALGVERDAKQAFALWSREQERIAHDPP